jgi:hypothetical protein
MKTDILITVRAGCGKGKTTLAAAFTQFLKKYGANVKTEDFDLCPNGTTDNLEKKLNYLNGKSIKIITQQCSRNEANNGVLELWEKHEVNNDKT